MAIVSISLIAWLVLRLDVINLVDILNSARPTPLLLALVLICLAPLAGTLRWLGVLHAQRSVCVRFNVALRGVLLAIFLNSFMPAKGGEITKALYLKRQCNLSIGFGTVVLERLMDLFLLGIWGLVGGLLSGQQGNTVIFGALTLFVSTLIAFLIIFPIERIIKKHAVTISEFRSVFNNWVRLPACILMTTIGSLSAWAISGAVLILLLKALGAGEISLYALSVFPLAILAGIIPVSVSGIGVRDSVLVVLLSGLVSYEVASLAAFGYTILAYWVSSIIAAPFVLWEVFNYSYEKDNS